MRPCCVETVRQMRNSIDCMGNAEFLKAEDSLWESIRDMQIPEADCFLEEFLPAYLLTLDETRPDESSHKGRRDSLL